MNSFLEILSKYMPLVLIIQYLTLAIIYLFVKDIGRALYWLGAFLIVLAVSFIIK